MRYEWKRLVKASVMILLTIVLLIATYVMVRHLPYFQKYPGEVDQSLRPMTMSELSKHDGTNPELPIYLSYEGNIYDVTAGKEFYRIGGVYHFLAGKDSTTELNIAGGSIIKRKYPIIARLIK